MGRPNDSTPASIDVLLSVVVALLAVIAAFGVIPSPLSVFLTLPMLLFFPGYAVTIALFPKELPGGPVFDRTSATTAIALDRAVLSVLTSLALAVIIGVNLDFTIWQIRPRTYVTALTAVTVICSAAALVRRRRRLESEKWRPQLPEEAFTDVSSISSGATAANIAVTLAVLIVLGSIVTTGAIDQRGEYYTEFGILTANEEGELTATDHPSTLTVGESTTWYYTLTNKKEQPTDYTVIVQLVSIGPDGETVRRTRVDSFSHRLDSGQTERNSHTVTPAIAGEDLQLRYLLYHGEPPEQPAAQNAYRDLHVWVNITDG